MKVTQGWKLIVDKKRKEKIELQEIKDYVETLLIDRGGIGIYDTFIHIDVRQKKARWDHRNDS